jgi:hypothetical protein
MEILVKYNFLINGSMYNKFSNCDNILFIINILNMILSYLFVIKFVISLFTDYKIEYLLLSLFYIMDLLLIYNINNIHIKKIIKRNITLILQENFKIKLSFLLKFIFCISIIIASTFAILLNNKYTFFILTTGLSGNNIINTYALFFLSFYSIHIKLSCITFFLIFINNLIDHLTNFITIIKQNNTDINNLVQQYLEIRHKYNGIIFVFNNIIANIISFSVLSCLYFILKKCNYELFDLMYIINFSFFCIFCILFHCYTNIIDDNIKYLKSLNDKNTHIKEYITRKKNLYTIKIDNDLSKIDTNEINFKNFILDMENGQSIDWLIFSNILQQPLRPIEIYGIEISNSSIITKIVSIFIFIIIGIQII